MDNRPALGHRSLLHWAAYYFGAVIVFPCVSQEHIFSQSHVLWLRRVTHAPGDGRRANQNKSNQNPQPNSIRQHQSIKAAIFFPLFFLISLIHFTTTNKSELRWHLALQYDNISSRAATGACCRSPASWRHRVPSTDWWSVREWLALCRPLQLIIGACSWLSGDFLCLSGF